MEMLVKEIVAACGGRLLCGDENARVTSVSTDSRSIAPGALFVPIKGERADAHDYIEKVFQAGAAATLTQEHAQMRDIRPWIAVGDTPEALRRLAAAYRAKFHIPVVGVTGSVGKTTTKEMVALALSAGLNVMKTEGNLNSQIGVPLTMFRLSPAHEAAVVEMGMSDFGEMGRLARVVRPDYAVVTNIGISHIENLKTQENIRAEKLHVADCFTESSVLFLNGDDPLLAALRDTLSCRTVFFGTGGWYGCRAEHIRFGESGTEFTLENGQKALTVRIPVPGMHNVYNALAAVAVAEYLGVDREKAAAALSGYRPPAMRQQIHEVHGVTVIDDSYNASPDSMRSGISVLCGLKNPGRRVGVFADMLELGDYSRQAHFDAGVYAAQSGVDALVTVGPQAEYLAEGALSVNPDLPVSVFQSNRQAADYLKTFLKPGDAVIVKGSRGMKTDEIVRALLQA